MIQTPSSKMRVKATIPNRKAAAHAAPAHDCDCLTTFTPGPLAAKPHGITLGYLLRKTELLTKLKISKSTLHAKLNPRSRYHDPSIPRPRYLERSRIPLWSEQEVDAWLIKLFDDQNGATEA